MKIGVLGTGEVGQALAGAFAEHGHQVVVGTRDPAATLARTDLGRRGEPPFSSWLADHPTVTLATFADAAVHADVVVNASSGNVSVDVVGQADAGGNLAGKVLIDVANALDFSHGFPPSLFVKDTDSLAETIQRAVPEARVVKTLSSVAHELMVDPKALADGDHTIFVSGDDAEAKAVTTELLRELGWTDILDLGELRTARGVEMMMPLWIGLSGIVGRDQINFKVVRPE